MFVTLHCSLRLVGASTQIADEACNLVTEDFLQNSPGTVDRVSTCAELCEASSECKSATRYTSGYCSHFSSTCSNRVSSPGATAITFQPRSYTANWALAGAYGTSCDFDDGEIYMGGGTKNTVSECLSSCEATPGCRSVIYDYASKFCSYVSTACEETIETSSALVSFSIKTL